MNIASIFDFIPSLLHANILFVAVVQPRPEIVNAMQKYMASILAIYYITVLYKAAGTVKAAFRILLSASIMREDISIGNIIKVETLLPG
jgi:hypothetical protein